LLAGIAWYTTIMWRAWPVSLTYWPVWVLAYATWRAWPRD
jgi:hypothetical protein